MSESESVFCGSWEIRQGDALERLAEIPDESVQCVVTSPPKAGSAPGNLVLDPFAGSGTTLWAAKMLGRKAIGIEIDAGYCDLIADRCSQDVIPIADPHDLDEALAFDFEAVA